MIQLVYLTALVLFSMTLSAQENPYDHYKFMQQDHIGISPYFERSEVCSKIPYNYMAELKKLNESKEQLKIETAQSFLNAQKIEALQTQITSATEHLNTLATPEYNDENYSISIVWNWPDTSLKKYDFRDVEYLGDFSPVLLQRFSKSLIKDRALSKWVFEDGYYRIETPEYDYLKLQKKATLLEICQFLPTLKIDLQLHIEDKTFAPQILNFDINTMLEVQ